MEQHNKWLAWKMKHGLATRGRVGGKLRPKSLLSGIRYKLFHRKDEVPLEGPQLFKQDAGGTLGPAGNTNGK